MYIFVLTKTMKVMTLFDAVKQFALEELDQAFTRIDGNYLSALEDIFLKFENTKLSVVIYDAVQEQGFKIGTNIPSNAYKVNHIFIDWYENEQGELFGRYEQQDLPQHIVELNEQLKEVEII